METDRKQSGMDTSRETVLVDVLCQTDDIHRLCNLTREAGFEVLEFKRPWLPTSVVPVEEKEAVLQVEAFITDIDEIDDVSEVWHNADFGYGCVSI